MIHNRRQVLGLAGSAAAAALLPAMPAVAVQSIAETATLDVLSAWVVGTPGEWDHQMIRASSFESAQRFWINETTGLTGCERSGDPSQDEECDCAFCIQSPEATRVPAWDDKTPDTITGPDWLAVGFETTCARCGMETGCDNGDVVGRDVVCHDCMTLADWWIVDPEAAAEKEVEQGPDARSAPAETEGRDDE